MHLTWDAKNLAEHHKKHALDSKEKKCWAARAKTIAPISEAQYEHESYCVAKNAWITYESSDAINGLKADYYPLSTIFVDPQVFVTIARKNRIHTSYHKHFGAINEERLRSGEAKIEFLEELDRRIRDARSKNVKIHDIAEAALLDSYYRLQLAYRRLR